MRVVLRVKAKWFNKMRAADRCPEKAGVGGSIPSLATIYFQRLSEVCGSPESLRGVQMESKLGFHSTNDFSSAGTTQR
jgi:hypothetical protein